jgi:trigger factor
VSEQQKQSEAAVDNASAVQSTVDDLGGCKKLVRVEVPVGVVDAMFDGITRQFMKFAQLPGFRPGKAPKHLVIKSYEGRIQEETKKKLLEDSFRAAVDQNKLRVVVTLNVEEQSFGRGMPFQFNVNCEVAPDFTLPAYKGLELKREVSAASDADVDRAVNILREQQVKYNDVSRASQNGDVVVVNYKGTVDGKPLTDIAPTARGLTEKTGFWLALAPDSFVPGFTEQLVGTSAGDKRTVNVTFPNEFVAAELSNRAAVYEVEVTGVKEKVLPEVNDEFAKSFGAQDVAELMAGIRRDLQNELDSRQRTSVRDQILKSILGAVQFDLPESIVTSETRNLVYNIVNQNQQRGVAAEVIEQKKDEIMASASTSAKDRVKAGFILNRIAAEEKIEVNNNEISQRIMGIAAQRNEDPQKVAKKLQEQNAIQDLAQDILTGKVLDFIELQAKIEEVSVARP